MQLSEFIEYLSKLEKTSSRIEITQILAQLFKKSQKNEIDKIIYLSLGTLAPPYKSIVFNLAERMVVKAVALAYKKQQQEVKKLYKKFGDLGLVAQKLASSKKSSFTVQKVYDELLKIALDEGIGSQERKISALANLLAKLDPLSARFIARIPVGNLRLGFSDKTIIDALSWSENGDKSTSKDIKKAYQVLPDIGKLAQKIKAKGTKGIAKSSKPEVGIPVLPMLPQRIKGAEEMVQKMGKVAVEPKFDGLRVLIHFQKGKQVKAFTRNLNDISEMFPELNKIGNYLKAKEVILDSEAVGLDPKTKKMVDFQRTMQRRRKHDIKKTLADIPLRFQIFDLILKDNKSYMNEPYLKRREVLAKTINKNSIFVVDEYTLTDKPEIIRESHKKYLNMGLEGVIIKKAHSTYVPGRTGWRWVKMKEVEQAHAKLSDTLDCVIMGYTQGRGKRAGFGIGQFLAGVSQNDEFLTISKVGTGLKDEQFKELKNRLSKIIVNKKPKEYKVHKDLYPDFWVNPEVVVELAADEITKSPKHTAGLALRFPRLIKFRDDKSPKNSTTLKEVKNLKNMQ